MAKALGWVVLWGVGCRCEAAPVPRLPGHRAVGERPNQIIQLVSRTHDRPCQRLQLRSYQETWDQRGTHFLKASLTKDTAGLQGDLEPRTKCPWLSLPLTSASLAYLFHSPLSLQTGFLCFPDCMARRHDCPTAPEFT